MSPPCSGGPVCHTPDGAMFFGPAARARVHFSRPQTSPGLPKNLFAPARHSPMHDKTQRSPAENAVSFRCAPTGAPKLALPRRRPLSRPGLMAQRSASRLLPAATGPPRM